MKLRRRTTSLRKPICRVMTLSLLVVVPSFSIIHTLILVYRNVCGLKMDVPASLSPSLSSRRSSERPNSTVVLDEVLPRNSFELIDPPPLV